MNYEVRRDDRSDRATDGPGSTARMYRDRHRLRPDVLVLEDRRLMATFTVNSTADTAPASSPVSGTLRWAVKQADSASSDSTIDFNLGSGAQMITLSQGLLPLLNMHHSTTIDGSTAALTISGAGKDRVFFIFSGVSATLSDLSITGGSRTAAGGGVIERGGADAFRLYDQREHLRLRRRPRQRRHDDALRLHGQRQPGAGRWQGSTTCPAV